MVHRSRPGAALRYAPGYRNAALSGRCGNVIGDRRQVKSTARFFRLLAEWALFLALTVAATWPVGHRAGTHIPIGSEPAATVPLLNLWTMWWNVDRIDQGYHDYWDAPIRYPTSGSFALSEPQPATGWIAWPLWHSLPGTAWVYNTLLILYLTLNGWISCQLLKRLRLAWLAAVTGGAMVCLLPLLHQQIGVFQLAALWGVVWTLLAIVRLRRRPALRHGLHLGVAFAVTYLLCSYYGLFLGMLLLCCSPLLLGRQLLTKRFWLAAATALLTAAGLVAPVTWRNSMRRVSIPWSMNPRCSAACLPCRRITCARRGPNWYHFLLYRAIPPSGPGNSRPAP